MKVYVPYGEAEGLIATLKVYAESRIDAFTYGIDTKGFYVDTDEDVAEIILLLFGNQTNETIL